MQYMNSNPYAHESMGQHAPTWTTMTLNETITTAKTGRLSVVVNNNLGVSYYAESDYEQAFCCFLKALQHTPCYALCMSNEQDSRIHDGSSKSSIYIKAHAMQQPQCDNNKNSKESFKFDSRHHEGRFHGTKMNFCRQTEFDEGMHAFMEALLLHDDFRKDEQLLQNPSLSSVIADRIMCTEAVVLFNLAQCQHQRSMLDEAERFYQKAYCRLLKIAGSQRHIDVSQVVVAVRKSNTESEALPFLHMLVRVVHKIGQMQYFMGLYDRSKSTFLEALNIGKKALGNEHPAVASTLNSLGIIQYHMRGPSASEEDDIKHTRALALFREALQIRMFSLGVHHKDVATTLNSLARLFIERDEFDDALMAYKEALRIRKIVLGNTHNDVAANIFNIAQTYHLLHAYDAAMEYYTEFLSMVSTRHTSDGAHRDMSIVLCLMGEIYQESRNLEKATTYYNMALQVGIAALGSPFHPEIALTLNKIGSCQLEKGDIDGAVDTYESGLRIERIVLDPWDPNLIVTLKNIGELHRQRGEYDKALEKFQEIMSIRIDKLKDTDPSGHAMLEKLRVVVAVAGKERRGQNIRDVHNASPNSRNKILVSPEMKALCRSFLDVAESVNDIATLYGKKGQYETALQYLNECLRIRRAILGDDHHEVAVNLYNMAIIHKWINNYAEALVCCRESLRAKRKSSGDEHICISRSNNLIGKILYEQGDLDGALKHHENALRVGRRVLGDEANTSIAEILTDMGNIYKEKGLIAETMKSFTEAARIYMMCGLSPDNIFVAEKKPCDASEMPDPIVAAAA